MTRKSRRVILAQTSDPSPVLPLVTELRMRAATEDNALGGVLARNHGDGTGPDGSYHNGRREAFQIAADLLEADPLYKAAPELRDLVLALLTANAHPWETAWSARAREIIATLPKEASK